MAVVNKRVVAFIGIAFLLLGVRFYDNGALNYVRDGATYYCYDERDNEYLQTGIPLLNSRGQYEKVILSGGKNRAQKLLADLGATTIKVEFVDGLTIEYAYSDKLSKCAVVGGRKVNITIAYASDIVVVGTPLIKGSF